MRAFAVACLLVLAACAQFPDRARVDRFTPGPGGSFTYSARTNTVMTENDDGEAEQIRRSWLTQEVKASRLCSGGFVIDSRRLVQPGSGIFANGGDIVYRGHCLSHRSPVAERGEAGARPTKARTAQP